MAQGTVPEGEIAQLVTFSHCLCAQIIILVCSFHPNDKNKRGLFLFCFLLSFFPKNALNYMRIQPNMTN